MKRTSICLLACSLMLRVGAAEIQWQADLPNAQTKAKAEGKAVLLVFTGSEKCDACVKFNQEVAATPEFAQYADKKLVLVEVAFPAKRDQDEAKMKTNQELKDRYKVSLFPTFVLVNQDGQEINRVVGHKPGGPSTFIGRLETQKKKRG